VRITEDEIDRRMGYHRPSGGQHVLYDEIRAAYIGAAKTLIRLCPQDTPQRLADVARAVNSITEAMRAAVSVVACNGIGAEDTRAYCDEEAPPPAVALASDDVREWLTQTAVLLNAPVVVVVSTRPGTDDLIGTLLKQVGRAE